MKPFELAQAIVPSHDSTPPRTVRLAKPQGHQAVTIHLEPGTRLDLTDIASDTVTFVRVGDRLVILFDNQSTVTIEPVFDASGQPRPDVTFELAPDRIVTGAEFAALFPITADQSVLPAAGNSGPTAGANFSDHPPIEPLGGHNGASGLLGSEAINGSAPGARQTAANSVPIIAAPSSGVVDEDGLGGNAGGPGDVAGTTTVTGSLHIDFGQDILGRSITFTAAQPGLSGLTSGGSAIALQFTTIGGLPAIIGYTGQDPSVAGSHVFEIMLDAGPLDGAFAFTLLRPLDHPIHGTEDGLLLPVGFTAADGNGDTTTGGLTIAVNDDSPTATAIAAQTLAESTTEPGNVFHAATLNDVSLNISWGADNANSNTGAFDRKVVFAPGTAADLAALGLTSDGTALSYTLSADGTLLTAMAGTRTVFTAQLSDAANGSYTFTLRDNLDHVGTGRTDTIGLTFNVVATDADGDPVSSSFNVNVTDDQVAVAQAGVTTGLVTADPPDGSPSVAIGSSLGITWRADDANPNTGAVDRAVTFANAGVGVLADNAVVLANLFSDGQQVHYVVLANGTALVGYTGLTAPTSLPATFGAAAAANVVFVATLSDADRDGGYQFTQYQQLDHQANGALFSRIDLTFGFIATDADGDAAGGHFTVTVNDTIPDPATVVVNPVSPNGTATLIHDETAGVQTDANKSDVAGLPSIFLGVSGLPGGAVGFAQRAGAVTVTPHYGADQTGTTTLALTDSAGHSFFQTTTNLFDTQTGNRIFLYSDATGVVIGRVGNSSALINPSPNDNGTIAFAIAIDDAGTLSFVQYRALVDDPATVNDPDDLVTLKTGGTNGTDAVFVTATSTDHDGDVATAAPSALVIRIADDGPDANNVPGAISENEVKTINLALGTDYTFGTDGAGTPAVTLGTATVDGGPSGVSFGTPAIALGPDGRSVVVTPGTAFDALAVGEHATLHIPDTVMDGDGDTVTKELTVTVNGANDDPAFVSAALVGAIAEDQNSEIINNGGFEGASSGWTTSSSNDVVFFNVASLAHGGSRLADLVAPGFLKQSIVTDNGRHYTLDFWANPFFSTGTLTVSWHGVTAGTFVLNGSSTYTEYLLDLVGTGTASDLTFTMSGVSGASTVLLDDVSLRAALDPVRQSVSGTIDFTDIDLHDVHTPGFVPQNNGKHTDGTNYLGTFSFDPVAEPNGGTGTVAWHFDVDRADLQFLAAGQSYLQFYDVTVSDGNGGAINRTVTITISGTNDAPVVDAHSAVLAYAEKQAATAIDPGITITDVDGANLVGAKVSITANFVAGQDVLGFTNQNGITGSYNAATGVLTLSGTSSVANYQAALASVTYFNSSNGPSVAPRTIAYQVDDGAALDHASNVSTATVTIGPVNDLPVITSAPGTFGVTEDQSFGVAPQLIINGGFESNSHDAQNVYTYPGWTVGGTFLYPPGAAAGPHSGNSDVVFATFTANATGTFTSQAFQTVAGQHYTLDFYLAAMSSSENSFSVSWGGQTVYAASNVPAVSGNNPASPSDYTHYVFDVIGTGGSTQVSFAFGTKYYWFLDDVSVKPAYTPGVELRSGQITFSDPDTADTHAVTVINGGNNYVGQFITALTEASGSGRVTWNFTVNDSDIQFLAANQTLTQTYLVRINDGHGGNAEQAMTVALTGVNDTPVLTSINPNLAAIAASQSSFAGQTVSSFLGSSVSDVDQGTTAGIAVTGSTASRGAWQFSIDGGANWSNFAAYASNAALLLGGNDLIRFLPDGSGIASTDTFSYVAWDQSTGVHGATAAVTAGGTSAFSIASDTAHLTVTGINPPVITSAAPTTQLFEDGSSGSTLVVNGGFESGNFSGWNTGSGLNSSSVVGATNGISPEEGTLQARLGPSSPRTLTESIATTAGTRYVLDFWIANGASAGSGTHTFNVSWNGVTLLSLLNPAQQGYREYTFDVVGVAGSTPLQFSFENDPDWWYLDNVSVKLLPAQQTANGSITFTDADLSDVHSASFVAQGANYVGSFVLDPVSESNGSGAIGWHFSASNSALQFLAAGQTVTQTYTVTIDDHHGATTSQDISVVLHGDNDTPVTNAETIIGNAGTGNGAGTFVVPDWALLANDLDPDLGSVLSLAGFSSSGFANSTAHSGGNVAIRDNTTLGGSFTYQAYDGIASGPTVTDTVQNNTTGTSTLTGTSGDDVIVSAGNGDTLNGNDGNDVLLGNGGADTLNGGIGSDFLVGGAGNDNLAGGDGNDKFAFQASGGGTDTITDFVSGLDGIFVDVASQSLTILGATDIAANQFASGTDASNAAQWGAAATNKFFVETATHDLYYSATGFAADRVLLAHATTGISAGDIHTY